MESKVKVENAPGKATTEVANSSGRVGEVGCVTGTEDTSKSKKVDVPNGELDTAWAEEDFILSEDYFAKECRLPNNGVMPNDITKALVSDEEVERCFGPRSGTKGRNGPKLNNCVGLPQSEVLHLFQKRINWARYAHERHRNQLRSSKARKEAKPIGPPIVRPLRVYKPPAHLILEPLDSEDASASPKRKVRSPKHEPNLKTEAGETSMLAKEEPEASVIMGGSLGEAPESSSVIPEVRPVKLASPASYMPGFIELKDDIAFREKLIAKLRADISALTEAIAGFRGDMLLANESIAKAESRYKAENANREKLESERATLAEAKLSLEIRLDDGGFDEENPEDMKLLHSLESEEEELNLKHSGVLSTLEECTVRLKQSQSELKLSRDLVEESKVQVENGEREIETAERAIAREQSKLEAQIQELNCLRPFAESPLAALSPRYIPTATQVTKTIFRLGSQTGVGEEGGLQKQHDAFSECIKALYQKTPHVLSERRIIEAEKRQCFNVKYTDDHLEYFRTDISALPCCGQLQMAGDSQSKYLGVLHISKCWGPCQGQLTYAGCARLLNDGRPCGLGLKTRRTREIAGCSSSSQANMASSQTATPAGKSRDRAGHSCVDSSGQVQLFHFFIETTEPIHLLEVWDRPGQDLFQMIGQEFFEKYGHDVLSLRKFVSSYLASTAWAITVIRTPSADGYLRVLSFSHAGIRSPNIVSKVGSASAHVGVVVVPTAHDQAFLAMEITPSYGRSSLEALLRVQTRVNNLSKEIAEAIAAIKLEQEEEFADSASEWA
ncbi:hypothetical protein R1sor_018559 [Riccia sorocarpa]|uniref:Uncharacterized protein n=1 Tax=Riccia sorocarpa TaxID=122646 RepID=A0ABD3ICR8_9MARC